jgi:hypothetical protein
MYNDFSASYREVNSTIVNLLDVAMSGENGREVNDFIQKIHAGSWVLFTSGYSAYVLESKGLVESE